MSAKRKKVVVAMSGGIDSSVAAFLLKKKDYDVIGVFMKFWHEKGRKDRILIENRCCDWEAFCQARRVAHKLGIPFYTWNFKILFKELIVDDFIKKYRIGKTPNPCVECNKYIKFGLFYKKAKLIGADYIATGHYVKSFKTKKGFILKKAKDKKKDQSYFLWRINPKYLRFCLFPLGNYTKEDVKRIAKKNKFAAKRGKESQEICFVNKNLQDFLKRRLKKKSGPIKDINSKKILGQHSGLYIYTLGQRRGLGLSAGPWYVAKKENRNNTLWVTNKAKDDKLYSKVMRLKKTNLFVKTKKKILAEIKPRYRHPGAKAIITFKGSQAEVVFKNPQRAITPGQSAVIYQKERMLGGGFIK